LRSSLPDFPWDALAPYGDKARAHPGGIIDLSVGTPVDPTPEFIQAALREASNSPSYPVTAGTPELRAAIAAWAKSRLGASGDFDVLPVIGSKELVAWLPTILESKKVLIPEIAYPTYHVGALIAQAQSITVPISAKSWPQADLAWMNSPSNPTGRVHSVEEIMECIAWSRANDAVLISDECYLEFDHNATSTSIMALTEGNNKNILAVHSLSKRSSMAGYRAAFMVGDSSLIAKIRELRKHAGMMVSLPVQKAMTVALGDDAHVAEQRGQIDLLAGLSHGGTEAVLLVTNTKADRLLGLLDGVHSLAQRGDKLPDEHFLKTFERFLGLLPTLTDDLKDLRVLGGISKHPI
jgi:succinyldiaminopimelate transaminase